MKLLKLTDEVYEYYRTKVKGNQDINRDQASRKITRNTLLAMPVPAKNDYQKARGNKLYIYGNMWIVVRDDTVIHISNGRFKTKYPGWFKDEEKYNELTKEFGIAN